MSFGWTDIEDIALALLEAYPKQDPLAVRFTQLRRMVETLADFEPTPGHTVNEQILEAVQAAWYEEVQDQDASENDKSDHDTTGYSPIQPFKPDA